MSSKKVRYKVEIEISKGIKVGGHLYRVRSGKEVNARMKESGLYGRSYHTEREILIDNSMPVEQISNSIIHEAIHAIDVVYDTKLSESQIRRIGNGVHQFLEQYGVSLTVRGRGEVK